MKFDPENKLAYVGKGFRLGDALGTLYAGAKASFRRGAHEVNTSLGLREVMMLNLPSGYYLDHHALFEPRLQAAYTFYHDAGGGKMSHTLRAGYGVENKLPSADYLYPDKVYHDFIALNAYFNDESKRLLITNTKIQNPVNPGLRANRNVKWEAGYDLKWQGWELSLTAFGERMRGGAEYFTSYTPTSYTYYYELRHDVDTKPTRDDFYSREMRTFMEMRSPENSARVDASAAGPGRWSRCSTPPCRTDGTTSARWPEPPTASSRPWPSRPTSSGERTTRSWD